MQRKGEVLSSQPTAPCTHTEESLHGSHKSLWICAGTETKVGVLHRKQLISVTCSQNTLSSTVKSQQLQGCTTVTVICMLMHLPGADVSLHSDSLRPARMIHQCGHVVFPRDNPRLFLIAVYYVASQYSNFFLHYHAVTAYIPDLKRVVYH